MHLLLVRHGQSENNLLEVASTWLCRRHSNDFQFSVTQITKACWSCFQLAFPAEVLPIALCSCAKSGVAVFCCKSSLAKVDL